MLPRNAHLHRAPANQGWQRIRPFDTLSRVGASKPASSWILEAVAQSSRFRALRMRWIKRGLIVVAAALLVSIGLVFANAAVIESIGLNRARAFFAIITISLQ